MPLTVSKVRCKFSSIGCGKAVSLTIHSCIVGLSRSTHIKNTVIDTGSQDNDGAVFSCIKSCLCILIFYNFHRQVPQSLIEAAEIDGAGHIKAYFQIAIPLSAAAIIVVTLFSFVWYWNEVDLVRTYLGSTNDRNTGLTTLMLELNKFEDSYNAVYATHAQSTTSTNRLNDAIKMAGTMLSIAPMMLMYFFLQKQFVESVDKAGITGE